MTPDFRKQRLGPMSTADDHRYFDTDQWNRSTWDSVIEYEKCQELSTGETKSH